MYRASWKAMIDRDLLLYLHADGWLYACFNIYLYFLLWNIPSECCIYSLFSSKFPRCLNISSWFMTRSFILVSLGYYYFKEVILPGLSIYFYISSLTEVISASLGNFLFWCPIPACSFWCFYVIPSQHTKLNHMLFYTYWFLHLKNAP